MSDPGGRRFFQFKRSSFYVLLVCIGISTVIWILNVTSVRNDQKEVHFPVEYINVESVAVPLESLPPKLGVMVRGGGLNDSQLQDTLVVDMQLMQGVSDNAFLITRQLRQNIRKQLSQKNVRWVRLSSDTLLVEEADIITRNIPVKADLQLNFKAQFSQAAPPTLSPASVAIKGPKEVLDSLQFVQTTPVKLDDIEDEIVAEQGLVLPRGCESEVNKVIINIPVAQFTESQLRLPIRIKHVPDSIELRIYPTEATVSYSVPLDQFQEVNPDMFRAEVDYNELLNTKPSRLTVNVVLAPEFVTLVKVAPERVEYILKN